MNSLTYKLHAEVVSGMSLTQIFFGSSICRLEGLPLPCTYYPVNNLLVMIHFALGNKRYLLHVLFQKRWEDILNY